MKVSRRKFVSTASCAAASLCAFPSLGFAANGSPATIKADARCTLLDLQSNCALPESFEGMRIALGEKQRSNEFALRETTLGKVLPRAAAPLIVAGAGSVRPETFGVVAELLEKGARVVWESGAAFLEPRAFVQQQALTRKYFGISIGRPLDVWPQTAHRQTVTDGATQTDEVICSARKTRAIGHERVPYLAYRWPREAHVRDFSRVIPVSAAAGHAIAHWGELPAAWSKSVGAGTLVFLGSPIGPALRAGDSEAHSLLHSMITV